MDEDCQRLLTRVASYIADASSPTSAARAKDLPEPLRNYCNGVVFEEGTPPVRPWTRRAITKFEENLKHLDALVGRVSSLPKLEERLLSGRATVEAVRDEILELDDKLALFDEQHPGVRRRLENFRGPFKSIRSQRFLRNHAGPLSIDPRKLSNERAEKLEDFRNSPLGPIEREGNGYVAQGLSYLENRVRQIQNQVPPEGIEILIDLQLDARKVREQQYAVRGFAAIADPSICAAMKLDALIRVDVAPTTKELAKIGRRFASAEGRAMTTGQALSTETIVANLRIEQSLNIGIST